MREHFKITSENDVLKIFIYDEKRTTLGRHIQDLNGRFSLNVLCMSDIDAESTS